MTISDSVPLSTSDVPRRDPIGEREHRILSLFDGALASVSFPDVSRASVRESAEAVRRAQALVERHELELAEARRTLAEASDAMRAHLERGLAYARVFATTPELVEAVEGIDRGARRPEPIEAPRKRGRPRKVPLADVGLLPIDADVAAAE